MKILTAQRLLGAVMAAAGPVESVSIGLFGVSASVRVIPQSQQAAAQATIDAFDWSDAAQDAWEQGLLHPGAIGGLNAPDVSGILIRAVAALLVDELNVLRQQFRDQAAAVAAATSLADLKTRWAALSATPDRTLAQARTAIANKINAGMVDS